MSGLFGPSTSPAGAPPSLAEPGADDGVGEAEAVAHHGGLLRVAVEALFDRDRDLFGGDAALDRLDHELGGVELLLAEDELGEDRGADGAIAVRAVGNVGAGDEADHPVEEDDAELTGAGVRVGVAED